jgi:hypothetical protein
MSPNGSIIRDSRRGFNGTIFALFQLKVECMALLVDNGVCDQTIVQEVDHAQAQRYCQMLWIGTSLAASIPGMGETNSSGAGSDENISAWPLGNLTPALTRATR